MSAKLPIHETTYHSTDINNRVSRAIHTHYSLVFWLGKNSVHRARMCRFEKIDICHNKKYVFGIDVKIMMSSIRIVGESRTLTSGSSREKFI